MYFLTFRKNRGAFIHQKGCIFINTTVLTPNLEYTNLAVERTCAWEMQRKIGLSSLRYKMRGCALAVMIATD